ncbi:hypothetical protein BJ508DRAFT_335927 [Ascobolus immersus RN42]|uniref:Ubiquitin-like domain-containing protein n=1 Tax=Ascobolus immersus RN42 TaxID=1160509 RepID=A0A3N4HHP5_ASCIM|nr:hypothetical protein BJ508DRAFT_335927 [Ascobolus immersus RN42]
MPYNPFDHILASTDSNSSPPSSPPAPYPQPHISQAMDEDDVGLEAEVDRALHDLAEENEEDNDLTSRLDPTHPNSPPILRYIVTPPCCVLEDADVCPCDNCSRPLRFVWSRNIEDERFGVGRVYTRPSPSAPWVITYDSLTITDGKSICSPTNVLKCIGRKLTVTVKTLAGRSYECATNANLPLSSILSNLSGVTGHHADACILLMKGVRLDTKLTVAGAEVKDGMVLWMILSLVAQPEMSEEEMEGVVGGDILEEEGMSSEEE